MNETVGIPFYIDTKIEEYYLTESDINGKNQYEILQMVKRMEKAIINGWVVGK